MEDMKSRSPALRNLSGCFNGLYDLLHATHGLTAGLVCRVVGVCMHGNFLLSSNGQSGYDQRVFAKDPAVCMAQQWP